MILFISMMMVWDKSVKGDLLGTRVLEGGHGSPLGGLFLGIDREPALSGLQLRASGTGELSFTWSNMSKGLEMQIPILDSLRKEK